MTILEIKNVFFMINGSKYITYVKIARGDRIPLTLFWMAPIKLILAKKFGYLLGKNKKKVLVPKSVPIFETYLCPEFK